MPSEPLPLRLFDFDLPTEHIAQAPVRPRDSSRLLVMPKGSEALTPLEHLRFLELPALLSPGDILLVNRTMVMPARLFVRKPSGGRVELLFVDPKNAEGLYAQAHSATSFWAMGKPGKALLRGCRLVAPGGEVLEVQERRGTMALLQMAEDQPTLGTDHNESLWTLMQRYGEPPLPHYIHRSDGDSPSTTDTNDYQSMFAEEAGAVAAPTASLHFTEDLVERLAERGVRMLNVLLHVGPGTFVPVREEHAADIREHHMHGEYYEVPADTRDALSVAQQNGQRVIAVGTTALRAVESWKATGLASGVSELFCYPGFQFRVVDGLITNFHLPRSTLLMLVSAFVGRERLLHAYEEAIALGYRFYSYGDAMFLQREHV